MDSIVNKLTEIEDAASAIVQHAEDQKAVMDSEFDAKRKAFDADLEKKTEARLEAIRAGLSEKTSRLLDSQNDSSEEAIQALRKEYEKRHTEYAQNILKHITEV